jgi:protein O-GlcNAc transferase
MDINRILHLAGQYYQEGNLQQAETAYKELLRYDPNNDRILNDLGKVLQAQHKYDAAIDCYQKAIQLNPAFAGSYFHLGSVFEAMGHNEEAISFYKKAIQCDPHFVGSYNNAGNVYRKSGRLDDAIPYFQKAIEVNPQFWGSYYNLGKVLQKKGQIDEAVFYFQETLRRNPTHSASYRELGDIYREKGNFGEAIICYQRVTELDPSFAGAYCNLGNVLRERGRLDEALTQYQKAIELDPSFAGAYYNLGNVFKEKGRLDEGLTQYQKAIELNPSFAEAYCDMGIALHEKGRFDEAISSYLKTLQLDPHFDEAYNNMGVSYREKGCFNEAISCYLSALQLNPNRPHAYNNLGCVYQDKGQIDEAEEWFRRAIEIQKDTATAYSNLLLSMSYNVRHDPRAIYLEHLKYSKQYAEQFTPAISAHKNNRDPDRKLNIGYVSPDFRRHPVAYFIEPVITAHNREHFEIFCYSNGVRHDEVTQRVREHADQWRNIQGMSDHEVTELIRKDEIDILVDLAGHTAKNRLLVFARKPAPVQISWIGYLATTGLSTMDYKIVDNYTDPPGKTEQFYTERLLRLPECFLCYLPDRDSPEVGSLPVISAGQITFGSFNNFRKVTAEVFTLWAGILNEIRNSRLILKGTSFYDKTTCQYAITMFEQRGIAAERVIVQPPDPSPKYLETYNLVDIGLDTFPFNGATTTCEALWMGVPVITLAGIAYHSSVGISLLSNVGLPELVAKTPDEYVSIAVTLARDVQKLRSIREHLRGMMTHSPLCDAKKFTANVEMCYRQIWEKWCRSI